MRQPDHGWPEGVEFIIPANEIKISDDGLIEALGAEYDPMETCPITHEPLGLTEAVSQTPCGHNFRTAAIQEWVGGLVGLSEGHNVCPTCRAPATSASLRDAVPHGLRIIEQCNLDSYSNTKCKHSKNLIAKLHCFDLNLNFSMKVIHHFSGYVNIHRRWAIKLNVAT